MVYFSNYITKLYSMQWLDYSWNLIQGLLTESSSADLPAGKKDQMNPLSHLHSTWGYRRAWIQQFTPVTNWNRRWLNFGWTQETNVRGLIPIWCLLHRFLFCFLSNHDTSKLLPWKRLPVTPREACGNKAWLLEEIAQIHTSWTNGLLVPLYRKMKLLFLFILASHLIPQKV